MANDWWREAPREDTYNPREKSWPFGGGVGKGVKNARIGAIPDREPAVPPAPLSEYQALMESGPHEDPRDLADAGLELREVLCDAIDALEPRELWVFNAHTVERKSLQAIAEQLNLSKSQVHRVLDSARARLQESLIDNPLVRERLGLDATDEDPEGDDLAGSPGPEGGGPDPERPAGPVPA